MSTQRLICYAVLWGLCACTSAGTDLEPKVCSKIPTPSCGTWVYTSDEARAASLQDCRQRCERPGELRACEIYEGKLQLTACIQDFQEFGSDEQNGDVESLHRALKRRLVQHLLLRGSRDFQSVEEYRRWRGRTDRHHSEPPDSDGLAGQARTGERDRKSAAARRFCFKTGAVPAIIG